MEWIMYTVGIVAHGWLALVIFAFVVLSITARDNVTNRLNISLWRIWTPIILVIAYWNWFFFG